MSGIGYRVSGIGMRVGCAAALLLVFASGAFAQHLRIFACAIGNDSSGAFMGGSTNGSGLYQSDDTGKTWKHLGWDNIKCYSMDMVQSSNGRILYMATGLGVLRSTDYGEHWKQITDWRISEVMDIAVDQKVPDQIFLATAHGSWSTTNAGRNWSVSKHRSFLNRVRVVGSSPDFFEWELNPGTDRLAKYDSVLISYTSKVLLDPPNEEPSIALLGTLGHGVLRGPNVRYPAGEFAKAIYCDPCDRLLPKRQIWRLKSFLVTP